MQLTVNQQYNLGLQESGDTLSDDMCQLLQRHFSGVLCTQSVEDCIGAQKNAGQVKQCQKYRRPEVSMATVVRAKVLECRHSYTPVVWDSTGHPKSSRLVESDFRAAPRHRTKDWQNIVSTCATAPFYSPSATNSTAPDADIRMLEAAAATGDIRVASRAWLGVLFDYRHEFAFEHRFPNGEKAWVMPLSHMPDSAVLALKCQRTAVAGCNHEFFPLQVLDAPVLLGVFDIGDNVVGCRVKARSWLWQLAHIPNCSSILTPAIRFFKEGPIEPVHKLACRAAFWSLSRPVIIDIAKYLGVGLPDGSGLLDVLTTMAVSVLGVSQEEALYIVHQRVVPLTDATAFSDALMQVDEAAQLLDSNDLEEFSREQAAAKRSVSERESVSSDYRKRAAKVRESRERAAAEKGQPAKRQKKGASRSGPTRMPPASTIPQSDAKVYIPPGASIWRGLTRGEWWGHFPPIQPGADFVGHTQRGWRHARCHTEVMANAQRVPWISLGLVPHCGRLSAGGCGQRFEQRLSGPGLLARLCAIGEAHPGAGHVRSFPRGRIWGNDVAQRARLSRQGVSGCVSDHRLSAIHELPDQGDALFWSRPWHTSAGP